MKERLIFEIEYDKEEEREVTEIIIRLVRHGTEGMDWYDKDKNVTVWIDSHTGKEVVNWTEDGEL